MSFPNASVLPPHSPTPASPQRNENSETDYIYLYFVQICAQKQHGAGFSLRPPSMENITHSCYSSGHIPMSHSSLRALAPSSTAWRQSSPQEVLRDPGKKHLQWWMEIHQTDTKSTADKQHVTTRGHQEEMQKAAIRCYLAIMKQGQTQQPHCTHHSPYSSSGKVLFTYSSATHAKNITTVVSIKGANSKSSHLTKVNPPLLKSVWLCYCTNQHSLSTNKKKRIFKLLFK